MSDEASEPISVNLSQANIESWASIETRVAKLRASVTQKLQDQDVKPDQIAYEVELGCLYDGSDTILQVPYSRSVVDDFIAAHLRETSFSMPRNVLGASVRVRGTGKTTNFTPKGYSDELAMVEAQGTGDLPQTADFTSAYFDFASGGKRVRTPVYSLNDISRGSRIPGPAIVADQTQTIVVEPGCVAFVLSEHVIIRVGKDNVGGADKLEFDGGPKTADPIMLAVFGNRFMSIAEQMGHTLQRTSISVSIKVKGVSK